MQSRVPRGHDHAHDRSSPHRTNVLRALAADVISAGWLFTKGDLQVDPVLRIDAEVDLHQSASGTYSSSPCASGSKQ
jgi:hypothetical protein